MSDTNGSAYGFPIKLLPESILKISLHAKRKMYKGAFAASRSVFFSGDSFDVGYSELRLDDLLFKSVQFLNSTFIMIFFRNEIN